MLFSLAALPLVRKRVYEVFLIVHIGCVATLIYALWQHLRSIEGNLWVFPLAYTCIFATGWIEISFTTYGDPIPTHPEAR